LKYLRAAFFVRQRVPGLGGLPVNVIAVLGFVALGFGHPGFWLLGLLLEIAFLWSLVASPRFRKTVDATSLGSLRQGEEEQNQRILKQLIPPHAEKHRRLMAQYQDTAAFYHQYSHTGEAAEDNLRHLRELESIYLRLLLARQQLSASRSDQDEQRVHQKISQLRAELQTPSGISKTAQASKERTLDILEQRLGIFGKKQETLHEIDIDLEQIEAQFQLALDKASMKANPAEAKLDLELAGSLASPEYLRIVGSDWADDLDFESEPASTPSRTDQQLEQ